MNNYDENASVRKEQESIYKQQENTKKASEIQESVEKEAEQLVNDRKTEEKRLADERKDNDAKTQERLRKESEERRKKQKSIAGHGNDVGTQTIRIAENYISGVVDSLKDIRRMAGKIPKKESLSVQDCKIIIKGFESLSVQLTQLDKINHNLKILKKTDTLKEKYETAKTSIQTAISKEHGIEKANLKKFEGKDKEALQGKDFRERIVNRIAELSEMVKVAKERLQEINNQKVSQEQLNKQSNNMKKQQVTKAVTPKR